MHIAERHTEMRSNTVLWKLKASTPASILLLFSQFCVRSEERPFTLAARLHDSTSKNWQENPQKTTHAKLAVPFFLFDSFANDFPLKVEWLREEIVSTFLPHSSEKTSVTDYMWMANQPAYIERKVFLIMRPLLVFLSSQELLTMLAITLEPICMRRAIK